MSIRIQPGVPVAIAIRITAITDTMIIRVDALGMSNEIFVMSEGNWSVKGTGLKPNAVVSKKKERDEIMKLAKRKEDDLKNAAHQDIARAKINVVLKSDEEGVVIYGFRMGWGVFEGREGNENLS